MLTRVIPVVVLAVAAFIAGVRLATSPGRDEKNLVKRYVTAWQHDDIAGMYGLLDSTSRARASEAGFAQMLAAAEETATLRSLRVLKVGGKDGNYFPVRMQLDTRLWGTFNETLDVPLTGSGSGAHVHLQSSMLFPGLKPGEALHRTTVLAPRGTLLASDGTPLAQGPDRTSPIPSVAIQIVGTLGPIPHGQTAAYVAQGYPAGAKVGQDGLERIFQSRLAGQPGGKLLGGRRVLADAKPVPGKPVTTTINPKLEQAAVSALGGQYAGMAVMNPRTGALEALAGIAFSALQPPGSTMKIITTSAALSAGIVKPSSTFPIQSSATIDGFTMQNASGEDCGGTLVNAFAVSCNSVFAPLGVRLGGARLVAMAQKFGFNHPSAILGAAESMIPSASKIGDSLAVGSSAIGQGDVLTTPLEMTDVAATIAMGGRRPIPTLLAHQKPRFVRVISPTVAHEVQEMMVAVVQYGTGTSAQIPGVVVAGKTGTAELTDTGTGSTGASSSADTDAWFVGYAPVGHPHVVAGALFPNQGAGGATAAPPVHDVIVAALGQ
ncbi:MAG: penicillin-binding transpeptidase domain-containing protein [Solirubrobacteraceae bacterium]